MAVAAFLASAAGPGVVSLEEPLALAPESPPSWSLSVSVLAGVADAFHAKFVPLAAVRRRIGPVSIEAFGAPAFSWESSAIDVCTAPGNCAAPTMSQLTATPGRLTWLAGGGAVVRAAAAKWSVGGLDAAELALEGGLGLAGVGYAWSDTQEHAQASPGLRWTAAAGAKVWSALEVRAQLEGLVYPASVRGVEGIERQLLLGVAVAWAPGGR